MFLRWKNDVFVTWLIMTSSVVREATQENPATGNTSDAVKALSGHGI